MSIINDFEMPAEFSGKSEEELLEEFLNDCPVTEESYISIYGGYYSVMKKLTSAAKNVLVWMTFNSELDRGRVVMQSINLQRLIKELEITEQTYYKSIASLKENDAIRGGDGKYYINPKFMWKGSDTRRRKFLNRYYGIVNKK
jgi:hypothetical protein